MMLTTDRRSEHDLSRQIAGLVGRPADAPNQPLLRLLAENGVRMIIVGWSAATLKRRRPEEVEALGPRLEICYETSWSNCEALARSTDEAEAMAYPEPLWRRPQAQSLFLAQRPRKVHIGLETLELQTEVPGIGDYDALLEESDLIQAWTLPVHVMGVRQLSQWIERQNATSNNVLPGLDT